MASVGKRLTAKAGPLPVWGWAVAAIGLYFAYSYLAGRGASTTGPVGTSYDTSTPTTSGGSSDQGVGGGSGMGSPVDNLSADYLAAYGQLVDAYGGVNSGLLAALLAGGGSLTTTELSGSGTSTGGPAPNPTVSTTGTIAATSDNGFIPSSVIGQIPALPAGTTYRNTTPPIPPPPPASTGRPKIPARVSGTQQFYTYKTQVPLKTGQTLGFAPGSGYYAK